MLIEREPSLRTVVVENDVIVTNLAKCKCFALNSSASMVWRILETPSTVEQICDTMLRSFDVAEDQCRSEVEKLIETWRDMGLVRTLG
ncbi:MAG: PqqD family protein [Sphingomonas sp.]